METVSERIKEALVIRGMRQVDIVEKTGIGKSSICTYISGEYVPKHKNQCKIAKALNVCEDWLAGYDVPMEVYQPDKIDLIIRYLDLANRYSSMICSNESVDIEENEHVKTEIYSIREQLGLGKIKLK
jgi:transcriptional regulator with XRE-family HTH domain